jgi:hypothetical protein
MAATVGQWPVAQQGRQVDSRSVCSVLAGSTFQVVVKCQGVGEIAAHGYYPRPGDALDAGKHIHQAVAVTRGLLVYNSCVHSLGTPAAEHGQQHRQTEP